jgi:hypothetical protein
MISSDLHGAEEPIRWTLGWQRQDRVCDEPMHREEEGRPHQDVLAETWLMGISPWQMGHGLDGQDATSASWTISRACGSVLGFFGTCDRLLEPQEGQRFAHWMVIMP